VVYGAFGGRFDQEMASLQALYKWSDTFRPANLWLYDEHTCACLLRPDSVENVVSMCPAVENLKSVGLIPLGRRCDEVTTSGLRWNLDESAMEFGGLVSTSNEMTSSSLSVQATHHLVFTAGIKSGAAGDWDEEEFLSSLTPEPKPGTSA
jgi:thiamine pyrophosphokinase